ncbi:hypothetical protein ACP70R_042166 [Stipagrostis hirtigluma subsp. patula]
MSTPSTLQLRLCHDKIPPLRNGNTPKHKRVSTEAAIPSHLWPPPRPTEVLKVSTLCVAGVLASSVRIWSTPLTQQVPPYPSSHCSRKFLAGGFVFTETSLSSLLSTAPEDHTAASDCLAWSNAVGH